MELINKVLNQFNIGSFIFLGLFLLVSVIELVFAFMEMEKPRRIVKPFCLLFLGLFAVVTLPNQPLIYIGAFLGMVGDILVLSKNIKIFALGALTFFLGHICYIIELLLFVINKPFEWWHFVIVGICFVLFYLIMFYLGRNKMKSPLEKFGMPLYYATLFCTLPFMLSSQLICPDGFLWVGVLGYVIFIVSDVIILLTKYGNKFKRYDFFIMLTYLVGQILIVFSLVSTFIVLH